MSFFVIYTLIATATLFAFTLHLTSKNLISTNMGSEDMLSLVMCGLCWPLSIPIGLGVIIGKRLRKDDE